MIFKKTPLGCLFALYVCHVFTGIAFAENQAKSADEIAKELSNPAGTLASVFTFVEYTEYKGDLPGADSQDGFTFALQPVLPFPVGDKGRRIIFRPLIPVPINQPVFDADNGEFDDADVNLGDVSFDLVFAGTEMKDKHNGFLWGVGGAGTVPTATDDDVGSDQFRAGPEVFGGIIRKWGTIGGVVNHQWDVGGSNDESHSVTAGQYFYALPLGQGVEISSGPNFSYDWKADRSGDALTLPVGIGLAKTQKFGSLPVKFQAQLQYFVAQPETFGAEWLLKFTVTPVIKNPFIF